MKSLRAAAALFVALAFTAIPLSVQAQMYWRLDTGWSKATDPDFKFRISPVGVENEVHDAGKSALFGGGIGYRFSPGVRTDLTLGYRGGYGLDDSDRFGSHFKADIKSTSIMANAYYDFSFGGFTPYLGAGLGWAQNKMDPLVTTFQGPGNSSTVPGGKKNNAAFALMAGIGMPVSTATVEIGYRYIDLGKFRSEAGSSTNTVFSPLSGTFGTLTAPGYAGAEGKLAAHELTLGVRFPFK